ncbi:MAG: flagellar biosynthesis protein FlhB [Erysipelotrichaceae bacterium]
MAGEKSEKATPKRRKDERKKGNVFQSKDLVSVIGLVASFYFLKFYLPTMLNTIQSMLAYFFDSMFVIDSLHLGNIGDVWMHAMSALLLVALPMLLFTGFVNIMGSGAQTKFLFSKELLKFKLSKLNPISGLKKMFALRGVVELLKSMIKITVLIAILYFTLQPKLLELPRLMYMGFGASLTFLGDLILSIVTTAGALFIFLGAADFGYQWYEHEKNMKMSKQDIKEEYKQMEGDPLVKGKIKQRQQEMSQRRMMQEVPNADVIIKNPTHFAIALKYTPGKQRAPIVVAKGMDHVALKILELAKEHDVPTVENKPLARGLYESVELDQEVPETYYQAVAEVLAFVYELKQKGVH